MKKVCVGTAGVARMIELQNFMAAKLKNFNFFVLLRVALLYIVSQAVKSRVLDSRSYFTITAEIHARSLANFYCQFADRHMNLKFMRRVSEREPAIQQFVIVKNKLMSVFNASVLLLIMNFVITLSKESADPLGYRLVDPQLL